MIDHLIITIENHFEIHMTSKVGYNWR